MGQIKFSDDIIDDLRDFLNRNYNKYLKKFGREYWKERAEHEGIFDAKDIKSVNGISVEEN